MEQRAGTGDSGGALGSRHGVEGTGRNSGLRRSVDMFTKKVRRTSAARW